MFCTNFWWKFVFVIFIKFFPETWIFFRCRNGIELGGWWESACGRFVALRPQKRRRRRPRARRKRVFVVSSDKDRKGIFLHSYV